MSEQNQEQQQPVVATPHPSPFGSGAWTETPPTPVKEEIIQAQQEPPKQEPVKVEPPVKNENEEIIDVKEWVKREYGWEDPEIGKKELAELREKAKTPSEIKFSNEASQKFFDYLRDGKEDDVYLYLDKKRKLSSAEKLNAADAIKLHIAQTNGHYTPADVEDVYEERYALPKKPVQLADEEDADFAVRSSEWQSLSDKVTRRIERDAIAAKQELSKLISDLVLPEIKKPEPVHSQPSQESLDALKKVRETFINALESDYSKARGFETKVKDESVELPVAFNIPDAEKVTIKESLKDFDVNAYIDKRWFDENGMPKIEQMIHDRYILDNLDKVLSGVANNAASQRLAHHIKEHGNVTLKTGEGTRTFQPVQQQNGAQVSPFSQGAWSETPPPLNQN